MFVFVHLDWNTVYECVITTSLFRRHPFLPRTGWMHLLYYGCYDVDRCTCAHCHSIYISKFYNNVNRWDAMWNHSLVKCNDINHSTAIPLSFAGCNLCFHLELLASSSSSSVVWCSHYMPFPIVIVTHSLTQSRQTFSFHFLSSCSSCSMLLLLNDQLNAHLFW